MGTRPVSFAGLSELSGDPPGYTESRVAVLPLPYERTTSYGKGTARGPDAILAASQYTELYDEELAGEPCQVGIATLPEAPGPGQLTKAAALEDALEEIRVLAQPHLAAGKFLVSLGGEHSLSLPLIRAAGQVCGDIGVVQFDAHADLRSRYEGTPLSHACVMRRVMEEGFPTLAVGVRSLSKPEAELIRERDLAVVWGWQLQNAADLFQEHLRRLPDKVYLTFDVDFFDPAIVPATGTPEPGGGTWYPTLELLRTLFRLKTVVAMDVVELAPIAGQPSSDFLVAKLIYKSIGYWGLKQAAGG